MADYYPQMIGYSERMYAPFNVPSSVHQVMETPALSTASVFPVNLTWSSSRSHQACPSPADNSIVVTPPAEASAGFPPPPYPYPTWSNFDSQQSIPMVSNIHSDCYFDGSSLENSPLSSPGSSDSTTSMHEVDDMLFSQSPPSMAMSASPLCDNFYTQVSMVPSTQYESASSIYSSSASPIIIPTTAYNAPAPASVYGSPMSCRVERVQEPVEHVQKEIKMPQRKGGIQLWQFLYSLLTNPEKKYGDIIQWTANKHQQEFRMLEPESIAIWWGHHKNKPGMTYEKFSRSLRYYYDKGILKKIPGEKFVYKFMIDPEVMYHHIGTSDCRPKIKPMPKAAKAAMSKFHKTPNFSIKAEDVPIVTQEPEVLVKDEVSSSNSHSCNSLQVCTFSRSKSDGFTRNTLHSSRSTGQLAQCGAGGEDSSNLPFPMQRCQSLENTRTNLLERSPVKTEYQALSIVTQVNNLLPHNNQYFSN